jgi:hypothetical protein
LFAADGGFGVVFRALQEVGDGGFLLEIQAEHRQQAIEGNIDSKAFTGDGDEDVDGLAATRVSGPRWALDSPQSPVARPRGRPEGQTAAVLFAAVCAGTQTRRAGQELREAPRS